MRKILLSIIVLFILAGCSPKPIKKVCFEETCFDVEIADTYEERTEGLMGREHMDEDKGMLFVFNMSGVYPFWMKDTLIPLDIIWINSDKEVVFIKKLAQPCPEDWCPTTNPDRGASYVLEINAGLSEKMGLELGDKLSFVY